MPHNVIFVVGTPRTGTSILVKCLEKSGYNIGKKLFGHKYKSQDVVFRGYNRRVKELLIKQLLKTKNLKQPIAPDGEIQATIADFWKYAALWNIEVLKDPLFYEIFGVWWNVSSVFRDQKFIWTHRNPMDVAKSAVRLKYLRGVPELEPITSYKVMGILKFYEAYQNIHEVYFPKCTGINVYFEDLLNDTQAVADELSEFIGRKFDTSLISKKETYKKTGIPQ